MTKGLLLALIAALILSAGWLRAQDSGGDDSSSDTSSSDDSTDDSDPGLSGLTAVDFATPVTDISQLDFATQQAIDAITNPWGGVSAPALPTDLEIGPGGNPVLDGS